MDDAIEILDVANVENEPRRLREIDRWKRRLAVEIGWHYDLDLIWLLHQIERAELPVGATIVDAGAGNGLAQFLLAARGYLVISVDVAPRDPPAAARHYFDISTRPREQPVADAQAQYDHRRGHVTRSALLHALKSPGRATWLLRRWAEASLRAIPSRFSRRDGRGAIEYVSADFSRLADLGTGFADALISVSAVEHNKLEVIGQSLMQFERVVKPGGQLFVTLSAARDRDWFFDACQGWCLTEATIASLFRLGDYRSNYREYDRLMEGLRQSRVIRRRVSPFYRTSATNGLPWGHYDPKYQPVGVRKTVVC